MHDIIDFKRSLMPHIVTPQHVPYFPIMDLSVVPYNVLVNLVHDAPPEFRNSTVAEERENGSMV